MLIGQVLDGRYRLLGELGAGGMSVVWRAQDEVLGRSVAVKVLAGSYAADAGSRERIRSEAQAAARLWHPNVTNVYDYGEWADDSGPRVPYVVMELLPGRTLSQRLAAGPLPPRLALRSCSEVAAALAAAHASGLVHRDVKPSNVMLTPTGAKVFDFGIAAVVGQSDIETNGDLLGTPAYLAPERLTGGEVLPASDVYALGLLIYRVFTNRLPWPAETTTQMLHARMYVPPSPLPVLSDVPAAVNEICGRCLAGDPADRPSAAEVSAALAAAAGIEPLPEDDTGVPGQWREPSPKPVAAAAVAGGDPRRRRRRVLLGGAVVALVIAIAATLANSDAPQRGSEAAPASSLSPQASGSPQGAVPASPSRSGGGSPGTAVDSTGSPVPAQPRTSRAAGPPGTVPTPARSTRPAAAPGVPVQALGGTVLIRCAGSAATVLRIDPAPGYTLKDNDPGPADEVQVVLISAANESEIKVKCGAGGPIAAVKESPQ